ncbi:MAG: Crp/Fnr family transcriptional regulator, partial [Candidatus Omnitrophica bacterium]|nr:Crp/Fnr family transcriptional regulator [Candidatus Omnitrophota bacterium]
YEKGEFIFECGEPCERIIIMQSGNIKIFRMSSSGREQTLEILKPGDTCACNPGVLNWKCSVYARAVTACRVWYLARTDYVRLVKLNPKLSQALNQILAQRLCRLNALVEDVSLESSKKKLVKFILGMLEVSEYRCQDRRCICIPYNYEEIAHRLGMVRETITRHLNQFKRQGFIDIKPHQIIVCNRQALLDILQ